MSTQPNPTRFHPLLIGLHWLMLLLIIGVYCAMEFRGVFPRGSDARELMKVAHFSLGVCILALVLLRIWARLSSQVPAIVPAPKPLENLIAKLMHLALYGFMIVMPVTGWLMVNAHGHAVSFFGLDLPMLIGEDKGLGHQLEEVHETLATLGYFLIGAHALAALVHHYVKRDNTLLRMSLLKRS